MSKPAKLTQIQPPDSDAAEQRAWSLIYDAFNDRRPTNHRHRSSRWLLVLAAGLLVGLGLVSATSAGRDAITRIRKSVGIEHAHPALFALPTQGRLLVTTTSGAWVVSRGGGKRYLGDYQAATWSPHGLYIAATQANELRAIEPDGDVRWTLSRPHTTTPQWAPSGYRISYHDQTGLRVVAGDGTNDTLIAPKATAIAAPWKPATAQHLLAYADTHGRVSLTNTDTKTQLRRTPAGPTVTKLAWSSDGRLLYIQRTTTIEIYRANSPWHTTPWTAIKPAAPTRLTGFSPQPQSHNLALAYHNTHTNTTHITCHPARCRFDGTGTITPLTFSPNSRWLILNWPPANQLLFLPTTGQPGIRATANITQQFTPTHTNTPTQIITAEWCC